MTDRILMGGFNPVAAIGGGGIYFYNLTNTNGPGKLTITNSTITNNTMVGGDGGAIFIVTLVDPSTFVTITNNAITHNVANTIPATDPPLPPLGGHSGDIAFEYPVTSQLGLGSKNHFLDNSADCDSPQTHDCDTQSSEY